jgi:hypothetical protein
MTMYMENFMQLSCHGTLDSNWHLGWLSKVHRHEGRSWGRKYCLDDIRKNIKDERHSNSSNNNNNNNNNACGGWLLANTVDLVTKHCRRTSLRPWQLNWKTYIIPRTNTNTCKHQAVFTIFIEDIPLCLITYKVNRSFVVAIKHNNSIFSYQFALL